MATWLMKSEPDVYGWAQLAKKHPAPWTDVRNYQARNNMQAMKKGDQIFFYHSNIGKEIVGIMEIVKEAYADPADPRFVLVDVEPVRKLAHPVPLALIKEQKSLQNIALIRQSRLSVMPITPSEWATILKLSEKVPD